MRSMKLRAPALRSNLVVRGICLPAARRTGALGEHSRQIRNPISGDSWSTDAFIVSATGMACRTRLAAIYHFVRRYDAAQPRPPR